jgi:transcription elongation factor GreA
MSNRIPMTPVGYKKVTDDLRRHKEVLRPQVVKDIEEARAHGDISENSEFEDAKERQALIEGRIRELESTVSMAEIVDISKVQPSDRVIFGVTVELEDGDTGDVSKYRIVGTEEADAKAGLISYTSPIGKALIGRKVGDEVRVEAPKGSRTFVINEVLYK